MAMPSRRYKPSADHLCVGCHRAIDDLMFARTGSVLVHLSWQTTETAALVNVSPVQYGIIEKRYQVAQRLKGLICSQCAGNFRSVNGHPIVMVDTPAHVQQTIETRVHRLNKSGDVD